MLDAIGLQTENLNGNGTTSLLDLFNEDQPGQGISKQSKNRHNQPRKAEQGKIFDQKRFFKWLCYSPVWKIDELSNPCELVFSALLPSSFLLKLETGLHNNFQESIQSFFSIKVFDLEKKVELKQLTRVIFRTEFFAERRERLKVVSFVDALPLYFAMRPVCPHCSRQMNLINPMNIRQMPFWAHTVSIKDTSGQKKSATCFYKQSLWGDFPNLDERRPGGGAGS